MQYLQENYTGIDVHTNSCSGLDGIVSMMHLLIMVIYLVAALFILTSVALISARLLRAETADTAIYKSLGIRSGILRFSFALRFLFVSVTGGAVGTLASALLSGKLIGGLFKRFGIGEFSSSPGLLGALLPPVTVCALFFAFALFLSRKIGRVNVNMIKLISENDE